MLKWSSRSVRIWPLGPPKQTRSVRLHPIDGGLRVELVGDLAKLIGFASDPANQKSGFGINPGSTEWLVAGAGLVHDPTIMAHVLLFEESDARACYQRYLHLDYASLG